MQTEWRLRTKELIKSLEISDNYSRQHIRQKLFWTRDYFQSNLEIDRTKIKDSNAIKDR